MIPNKPSPRRNPHTKASLDAEYLLLGGKKPHEFNTKSKPPATRNHTTATSQPPAVTQPTQSVPSSTSQTREKSTSHSFNPIITLDLDLSTLSVPTSPPHAESPDQMDNMFGHPSECSLLASEQRFHTIGKFLPSIRR
ncbi:uncharacterized protein PGTG_20618 [Puccinia graminis f. sp. tritici CRL 75-36-700-3]|uniref:Uncharacterized protein n=1 Tax=Puccinia graminis f. sp. tritici (strain CRL 75-36-700-3 / race SCCL) TaxID=418459 RepID=H6QNV4_PUCGT|nr:uncharacterized protein PGTG_20618 [Puccinia graminis f. sp. tritici CRL 75-36-700-3]EHS62496.1 hypothetical protein PGTG_20618 [Puccinia graminis f. sp. tritici CRL 75-36-700-3]